MMTPLEARFHAAMLCIYHEAAALGYRPSYFLRMVQTSGGLEAARQLLDASTISEGFTRLFELQRLDLSVEAVALRPEYRELFTDAQHERARARLNELGYNCGDPVDA